MRMDRRRGNSGVTPKFSGAHVKLTPWGLNITEQLQRRKANDKARSPRMVLPGGISEDNPNLDGDYKALIENRKKRKESKIEINRIQAEYEGDVIAENAEPLHSMPTQPFNRYELLRRELMNAVAHNNCATFDTVYRKVVNDGHNISHPHMRDPNTSATALHVALQNGSMDVARLLVTLGEPALLTDEFDVFVGGIASKKNALHFLSLNGDVALAEELLKRLPETENKRGFLQKTVLMELEGQRPRQLPSIHIAALNGHMDFVKLLVRHGVSVNAQNTKHDSPILWATRGNHVGLVKWLIDKGADVNSMNDKGSTALYWAVRYGFEELTELLLRHGQADVNMKRKLGLVCPIILAAAFGNVKILQLLISYGADVNTKIRRGETAMHHAASWDNVDAVRVLLKYVDDIDFADEKGDTALTLAAQSNSPEVVQLLVRNGADPSHTNQEGKNGWTYAIDAADSMLLKALLMASTKGNNASPKKSLFSTGKKTPLHQAAVKGDTNKVSILLSHGVDPLTLDEQGNTFLHIAASENNEGLLKQFIGKPVIDHPNTAGETPLHCAARCGNFNAVSLLAKSAKVSIKNRLGETPLHIAAKSASASPSVVRALADSIVKTHNWTLLDDTDNEGNTALHLAAENGKISILEELDDLNSKIVNNEGITPLHLAALNGKEGLLEIMLDIFQRPGRDLDINQQNRNGDTLLHIAAMQHNSSRVQLLIKYGADLSIQNSVGNTVLHELTESLAADPETIDTCSEVFDIIVTHSVWWWCNKMNLGFHDGTKGEYNRYKEQAMIYLTSGIYNNEGKNVIAYAIKRGSAEMVRKLLTIPDVFVFYRGKQFLYDVTNITVDTIISRRQTVVDVTKRQGDVDDSEVQVVETHEDEAYVNMIVEQPTKVATEMLDITPIYQVVENYWSGYQWVFVMFMAIHIVYMALLSTYAVPLIRNVNATLPSQNYTVESTPYFLFLIWPILLLLFDIYYFIIGTYRCIRKRADRERETNTDTVRKVVSFLTDFTSTIFAVLVIMWFAFYCTQNQYQDIVLAVALIIGWLYTTYFTKGFSNLHHYSVMLRYIVVRDIIRFLFFYLFVLLAFSFALHALFQISQPVRDIYRTPWHTMFAVFNLMMGMWELFDSDFEQGYSDVGRSTIYVKIVYIIYIALASIILINLLIAMMNESYTNVNSEQGEIWRVGSIELAIKIDRTVPFLPKLLRKLQLRARRIHYDFEKGRWFLDIASATEQMGARSKEDAHSKSFNRLEYRLSTMQNSFDEVVGHVNKLTAKISDLERQLNDNSHNAPGEKGGRFVLPQMMTSSKVNVRQVRVSPPSQPEASSQAEGYTNPAFQES